MFLKTKCSAMRDVYELQIQNPNQIKPNQIPQKFYSTYLRDYTYCPQFYFYFLHLTAYLHNVRNSEVIDIFYLEFYLSNCVSAGLAFPLFISHDSLLPPYYLLAEAFLWAECYLLWTCCLPRLKKSECFWFVIFFPKKQIIRCSDVEKTSWEMREEGESLYSYYPK